MSFNLLDEPWILVQTHDGPDEVTLAQAFTDADRIRTLTGEVPTQGFAILRLMLAVCHDAIGWRSPRDLDRLHARGVDRGRVVDYLAEHHDRFDLFHPERPFMQVADLRTGKGEHSGLAAIIADVPNNSRLFSTRAGRALETIPPAEAARWLVHAQAFDPSGIRSAAVGDAKTTGGKGYPIGAAWSGQIGGIVLHGANLAETLALNITRSDENANDVPCWRLEKPQTEQRTEDVNPAGPVQALVWQPRRIRLVGDRNGVRGAVLCQGDKVTPQFMRGVEPMTAWRYSKPQSKKFGQPIYMPNEHDPGRAMWRGLPALVAADHERVEDGGSTFDRFATADSVTANAENSQDFTLQVVGIEYGPQSATVAEIIDDRMELHAALLRDDAVDTRTAVLDGVANAEACVRALGQLAANIARAAGERGDSAGEGARGRATAEAWATLDAPARAWIGGLDRPQTPVEVKQQWQRTVKDIVGGIARQLVDSAGPAAIRGRDTSFGFMSDHRAYGFFLEALRKELPLIHPQRKERVS